MSLLMNVQYSVFSNNHIEPTPDLVNEMLQELNDLGRYGFIPSMIASQNIDLVAGKINPMNNVSFVTIDQSAQIKCMDDRIDVLINVTGNNREVTLEDHIEFARDALSVIMKKNNIYSNRLALNVSLLSDSIGDSIQKSTIGSKLCKTLDFYTGRPIEEWLSRVNSRRLIHIDNDEILNVITEISLVSDSNTGEKRFLCHMDINTIFENSGFRFSIDSLKKFDCNVVKIIKEIKNDFEEISND